MTIYRKLNLLALCAAASLWAASALATNVSTRPLKADVLIKPNVIFGMDDSGSMDWEVLENTSSGVINWNGASAWDTAKKRPLQSTPDGFVPYVYLMPVGTNTGGAIYAYNNYYGQSLPPTNQFAWVRSSKFNPIYYDTAVTYPAWAPAYVGGAQQTYSNASITATSSHPAVSGAPTLNVSTQWTSANANFSVDGYRFYVQAGIVLPIGTVINSSAAGGSGVPCSGNTSRTLTAAQTVGANTACWASIPYYPATFWQPETCTLGTNCIASPDGVGTLKRYEIKSGNSFPSGRSYANEIQNFANWFSYYRKRKLMLAGSMGRVLESISGLRMDVTPFNSNPTLTMNDADGTDNSTNRYATSGKFYLNAMVGQGTPTHQTVKNIAAQFDTNSSVVQYACQRNSMFIVTDGFSNTTSIDVPTYDPSTWGATPPYTTTAAGSLADLALYNFSHRLRSGSFAAGRLTPSSGNAPNADKNTDLHINTYAITLGVQGSLWPNTVDPYVSPPTWPAIVADSPSMIDDQWHATINGRGQMYLATDPTSTVKAIRAGLDDILNQGGNQAAVSVSTVNLRSGDGKAYQGEYNPRGWAGDLKAYNINTATGLIDNTPGHELWKAADVLASRTGSDPRVIVTGKSVSGSTVTVADFSATDSVVAGRVNPGLAYGSNADVMGYLRGVRTGEGTTFRSRTSLMGAIIGSRPVVSPDAADNVIYVVSGDGMLHAFDTTNGKELWAYVPYSVNSNMGRISVIGWSFQSLFDGAPTVTKIGNKKILIVGLGTPGKGFVGIDVTSPRDLKTAADFAGKVWEYTGSNMGLSVGKPVVVNTSGGTVALLSSGYNGTNDAKGRVYVVDAVTGTLIRTLSTTGSGLGDPGLADISAFQDADGTTTYAYGGDENGNLWRFNVVTGVTTFITQFRDSASGGNAQPITTAPELAMVGGDRIVMVGTGRLLDIGDFGSSRTQTFYALKDNGASLANARTGLVARTLGAEDANTHTRGIEGGDFSWTSDRGWYLDLPAGQLSNTDPVVAFGAVLFTTNVADISSCSSSSYLYLLDIASGKSPPGSDYGAVYLTNALASEPLVSTTGSNTLVANISTSDNGIVLKDLPLNSAVKARKNAWRQVNRP